MMEHSIAEPPNTGHSIKKSSSRMITSETFKLSTKLDSTAEYRVYIHIQSDGDHSIIMTVILGSLALQHTYSTVFTCTLKQQQLASGHNYCIIDIISCSMQDPCNKLLQIYCKTQRYVARERNRPQQCFLIDAHPPSHIEH